MANIAEQTARSLPVLWHQREYALAAMLLLVRTAYNIQMVKPAESVQIIQLAQLCPVFDALPIAEAENYTQAIHAFACFVRYTEEPDVGNPQVRFCEGH